MTESAPLGMRLGAHVRGADTRFALYTSTAERCAVRLFHEDGRPRATLSMRAEGRGLFALETREAPPDTLYKFVLDERELPDPYARFLPQGVHGPARVCASRYNFRNAPVQRPLSEQVIYELHVGTFTPEGTYESAQQCLDNLVELGVTAIELLPVAAFAGQRGWGYDGVALFAPHPAYGEPDALRAFVDHAHGLGLSVLLDVVYNHFGPAGNYLSAYSPDYFTSAIRNAWGDAPNFAHPAMRQLVLENARYWLEEFRFDGLRLDAVHAIVDPSPRNVLTDLVEEIRSLSPAKVVIAEDDRNEPKLVTEHGVDGIWSDDFHHVVHVLLTGERDGYYAAYEASVSMLATTLQRGWLYEGQPYAPWGKVRGHPADALAASNFVYNLQNHDQVGNRAFGARLHQLTSLDAYCMASALLLFLPMTPLLFMGQEWAASAPFQYFTDHEPELGRLVSAGRREEFKQFQAFSDPNVRARIPDSQDAQTFERSKLDWQEVAHEPHARVRALYRALLELRASDPVLKHAARDTFAAEAHGDVLLIRRWHANQERLLLANFGARPQPLEALSVGPEARLCLASAELKERGLLGPKCAHIYARTREAVRA